MLVPDLAHQLLHDVLHGDNALGAAVLVHHHGHVGLFHLERAQQMVHPGVGGGVVDGGDTALQVRLAPVAGGVEVLFVDHAHNVIQAVLIHRQAGVAALGEHGAHLVHGGVPGHGGDLHAGGKDIAHLQVAELDGRADQLALVLVQTALVLRLRHHGDELLFGDARVVGGADDTAEQALPLGEQEVQRRQHRQQHPQQRGRGHGKGLGALLGDGLGGYLAEDQHGHRQHHGGHGGAVALAHQIREEHGAHGGGGDVDDVVADEDGGEQAVIVLRHAQRQRRAAVSCFRLALEADLVEAGKGGLRGGEVG